jgi:hypothetical protein
MPKKHSPSTISLYFFLLNLIPSQQLKTTFAPPYKSSTCPFCISSSAFLIPQLLCLLLPPPSCLRWSFSSQTILGQLPSPPLLPIHVVTSSSYVSFLKITLKVSFFMSEQSPPTCLLMYLVPPPKVPQSLTSYFYLQSKLMIMGSQQGANQEAPT